MTKHHLSHQPALQTPLTQTAAESIEPENQKSCLFKATRNFLTFLALSFGSGLESLQFLTGLLALNDYLLGFIPLTPAAVFAFTALYAVQCMTLNGKYAKQGIEDILDSAEGIIYRKEKIFPLPAYVYFLSFVINTLATLIDTVGGAYYLELQWGLNRELTYIMSAIAALSSNGPTEILEAHRSIANFFSPERKILKATLKIIKQSDFYSLGSSAFKNRFDTFWEKISPYLQDGSHKNPEELAVFVINLINDNSSRQEKLAALKIDKNKIGKFLSQIDLLQEESGQYSEELKKSCCKIAGELLYTSFKLSIKTGGAIEDLLISYIFLTAAFSEITSPEVRTTALVLSTANLFNDFIFNGNMNSKAIDTFKDALSGQFSLGKNILFFLSVCLGSIISHAEFALLTSLLRKPDSELPWPLPPILPEPVILTLASLAMLRAGFSDSYYFMKFFIAIGKGIEHLACRSQPVEPSSEAVDPELTIAVSRGREISIIGSLTTNPTDDETIDAEKSVSRNIPFLSQSAPSASNWPRLFPGSIPFSLPRQSSTATSTQSYTPISH